MSNYGSSSDTAKPDLSDVEMVFGTPNLPTKVHGQSHDVHTIAHEKKTDHDLPRVHNKPMSETEAESSLPNQPLLEPDRGRPKPPLAGPEIDDLDEEKPATDPYPGVDDGLLVDKDQNGGETEPKTNGTDDTQQGVDDADDGKWMHDDGADETDFNYGDGFVGNGLHNRFDDRPVSPMPGSIPDVNTYQQKKNLAQGMMDLALLSANANQLRYVLESSSTHPYFYPSLVFISCSIILQVAVGVGLIMNSRYDVKDEKDICKADKINNMTVLGIFLVTIVNVFITSFSVATPTVAT